MYICTCTWEAAVLPFKCDTCQHALRRRQDIASYATTQMCYHQLCYMLPLALKAKWRQGPQLWATMWRPFVQSAFGRGVSPLGVALFQGQDTCTCMYNHADWMMFSLSVMHVTVYYTYTIQCLDLGHFKQNFICNISIILRWVDWRRLSECNLNIANKILPTTTK